MKTAIIKTNKYDLFKYLSTLESEDVFIIADENIKNHLPQWIIYSSKVFWLKNPEESKNLDRYQEALFFFLDQKINRHSVLYAIGGGGTSDFAGFVAATILRGIEWQVIPTTLLSMIDASIGGKVGLNTKHGKNLVGAFHQPEKVLVCTDFLTTLPQEEWVSGKGELLKYAFLSKEVNKLVHERKPLDDIILACGEYKNNLTSEDFKEKGNRIILNLGHTLGHAFESYLKIPHGSAVLMGMKYLFKLFDDSHHFMELCGLMEKLDLSPKDFHLKNFSDFKVDDFLKYLEFDKKRKNNDIQIIIVHHIGDCRVKNYNMTDFKNMVKDFFKGNHESP